MHFLSASAKTRCHEDPRQASSPLPGVCRGGRATLCNDCNTVIKVIYLKINEHDSGEEAEE